MTTTTEFAPEQAREAWDRIHELEKLDHTELARRCYTSEGKLSSLQEERDGYVRIIDDGCCAHDKRIADLQSRLEDELKRREEDANAISLDHQRIVDLESRLDAIREWLGEGRWSFIIEGIEKRLHEPPGSVVERGSRIDDVTPREPPPRDPLPENVTVLISARTLGLDQLNGPGGPRAPIEPDEDGDCKRCGYRWEEEERAGTVRHECPPGFLSE
jgi:hypothetical protein